MSRSSLPMTSRRVTGAGAATTVLSFALLLLGDNTAHCHSTPPPQHQQQPYQGQHHHADDGVSSPQEHGHGWGHTRALPPRGGGYVNSEAGEGGAVTVAPSPDYGQQQEQPAQQHHNQPATLYSGVMHLLNVESVALALRLTCETNRRLQWGTDDSEAAVAALVDKTRRQYLHMDLIDDDESEDEGDMLRPGALQQHHHLHHQHHPVNVHPSQTWQPPIRRSASSLSGGSKTEELTIFHGKAPRVFAHDAVRQSSDETRRGPSRWGPDLSHYLGDIADALGTDGDGSTPAVLALAMIYLDRACSVETVRPNSLWGNADVEDPQQYCPPCPYVSPRTVHRLVLTAMVIADRSVRVSTHGQLAGNISTEDYASKLTKFGIGNEELERMESWMLGALGEQGLAVSKERLEGLLRVWSGLFLGRSSTPPKTGGSVGAEGPSTVAADGWGHKTGGDESSWRQRSPPPPPPSGLAHSDGQITTSDEDSVMSSSSSDAALSCWA